MAINLVSSGSYVMLRRLVHTDNESFDIQIGIRRDKIVMLVGIRCPANTSVSLGGRMMLRRLVDTDNGYSVIEIGICK